jgi:hypothetical protein
MPFIPALLPKHQHDCKDALIKTDDNRYSIPAKLAAQKSCKK